MSLLCKRSQYLSTLWPNFVPCTSVDDILVLA